MYKRYAGKWAFFVSDSAAGGDRAFIKPVAPVAGSPGILIPGLYETGNEDPPHEPDRSLQFIVYHADELKTQLWLQARPTLDWCTPGPVMVNIFLEAWPAAKPVHSMSRGPDQITLYYERGSPNPGENVKFAWYFEEDRADRWTYPEPKLQLFAMDEIPNHGDQFTMWTNIWNIIYMVPGLDEIIAARSGAGLDLSHVDFTGVRFPDGMNFRGADLSYAILDGVSLVGADLREADMNHAQLSGCDLRGAKLNGADLSDTDLSSIRFDDDTSTPGLANLQKRTSFQRSRLPYGILRHDWRWIVLDDAAILDVPYVLSSEAEPLMAEYASIRNQDFTQHVISHANFDNSDCSHTSFSGSALNQTSFVQALLYNTNLSGARMKDADFRNAQLGAKQISLTIPNGVPPGSGQVSAALRDAFARHGIALDDNAHIVERVPGRVWLLNAHNGRDRYELVAHGSDLVVSAFSANLTNAANLSGAWMPRANMSGANLFACDMTDVVWSDAKADSWTDLESARLDGAVLDDARMQQSRMFGIGLQKAVLVNANLNGATLAPSANAEKPSLVGTALQGADLTDAVIASVNLGGASVSRDEGAPLFALPKTVSVQPGQVDDALQSMFRGHGYELSANASIALLENGDRWIDEAADFPLRPGWNYSAFRLVERDAGFMVFGVEIRQAIREPVPGTEDARAPDWDVRRVVVTYNRTALDLTRVEAGTTMPSGVLLQDRRDRTDEQLLTPPKRPALGDPGDSDPGFPWIPE